MHPYLIEIPLPGGRTFPVASYGFMILCGFLLCLWLLQRRGRRMGIDPVALFDTAVLGLIGGIVGARAFYVVHYWEFFADQPIHILFLHEGGLSFFGGLMGGIAGLLGSIWKKGLPLRATLDLGASLLPLGHAVGRMGCFLNGCCFGKVTDGPLGVRFPGLLREGSSLNPMLNLGEKTLVGPPVFRHQVLEGWPLDFLSRSGGWSDAFVKEFRAATEVINNRYHLLVQRHWTLPVHPTQLYAVGYNLAIFALLSYLLRRRWRPGQVGWCYLMLYGTARYWNEFFRADTARLDALGGLTLFQGLAIAGILFGAAMFIDTMRRPPVPVPEPYAAPD